MSRPRSPQLVEARRAAAAQARAEERRAERLVQARAAVPRDKPALPSRSTARPLPDRAGARGGRALPLLTREASRPPRERLRKPSADTGVPRTDAKALRPSSASGRPPTIKTERPTAPARRPLKAPSGSVARGRAGPERPAPPLREKASTPTGRLPLARPPLPERHGARLTKKVAPRANTPPRPARSGRPEPRTTAAAQAVRPLREAPARLAPAPKPGAGALRKPSARSALKASRGQTGPASAAGRPSAGLPWLHADGGALRDAEGNSVRLIGLQSLCRSADPFAGGDCGLLASVPPGQGCVARPLSVKAQVQAAALATLDEDIALHAQAGCYTLLRLDARLWLRGHHLTLARRYAEEPAVLFALMGLSPLAGRMWAASLALRALHPRALVWLPLESARVALQLGAASGGGLGLLWDASRPRHPHGAVLQGTLHAPVLIDGWQPTAHHPMAHDRLMSLCRQGGLGWIARSARPWFETQRGQPAPSRAALVLQRALHLSGVQATS